jgi:hypothetical protein
MKILIKIPGKMLCDMRRDLHRAHAFALERVGFLTAGVVQLGPDTLLMLARDYRPVADEDYVPDHSVGAKIGSDAMRKGAQFAYKGRSALFHIHMHGGAGRPEFSGVDLKSGAEFVPAFFHSVPRMPHGMLVLSQDSATGLVWFGSEQHGRYATEFVSIGAPYRKFGARQ